MNFPKKFESDYNWFLSVSDKFAFDGTNEYFNKKGNPVIVENPSGISAKEAFYLWDSQGVIKPTNDPQNLLKLLKTKGSVNLHIKMYAEDRASGILGREEFEQMAHSINAPQWFINAVERQKWKYYNQHFGNETI